MASESLEREGNGVGPSKEAPFTKPAWMRAEPRATDGNLFCRSSHTYVDLAAEAERRKRRKAARKAEHRSEAHSGHEQSLKRRRISDADIKAHGQSPKPVTKEPADHLAATVPLEQSVGLSQIQSAPGKQSSLTQDYERGLAESGGRDKNQRSRAAHVIDLESDSGGTSEPEVSTAQETRLASPISRSETELAPDEEFPELARRARERARKKRLEQGLFTPAPANEAKPKGGSGAAGSTDKESGGCPTVHDPTLEILITSPIENTQPLIVSRKLSQRLKDVRLAWTHRQGFTPDFAEAVFLTWRGKRLFDVMSCKSLGLGVDSSGVIRGHGALLGDEGARLHMEAMTLETLEVRKKAKEDARTSEEPARDTLSASPAKAEAQIKIILVGRDHEDFRLRVKSATTISKIISAFRGSNEIQPEKEVFLLFDGERLSPQCKVGETEISDMDKLEVYVR